MDNRNNVSLKRIDTITDTSILAESNSLKQLIGFKSQHFYQSQLLKKLEQLQDAELIINDPLGCQKLGTPGHDTLTASITFNDMQCYQDIALGGSNAAAEAYIQGRWTTNNLTNVIRIMARNSDLMDDMDSGVAAIATWFLRIWHNKNKNSIEGSRKNISAHYDLGNEFFRLFLDDRMMYSSYIYQDNDNLHQASTRKLQTICDQLNINDNDHILEIGSGWGGFACYAAKQTGCKVTTITISQEQFDEATSLVECEGLQQQVFVKLQDYRDITEQFDKVVSIEMIEAVGHHYLSTYFQTISNALKPNGQALIQAITVNDHRYEQSLKDVDFIKRYIFPGSFIPCVSVISQTAGKQALVVENLLDIGPSYATTLKHWRERFFNNIDEVRKQGFDERFIRLWEFYLCYCEGGFTERSISNVQVHFRKAR
ncbi:MAG: class I SAM-dependent methyltransferase [Arenicella sp.]